MAIFWVPAVWQSLSSRARVVEVPRGFLLSNKDVAVRERLDVLVFLDIGMDTHTTMWAADRLAPIQVGSRAAGSHNHRLQEDGCIDWLPACLPARPPP